MKQASKIWGPRIVWPTIFLITLVLLVFTTVRTLEILAGPITTQPNGFGPPLEFTSRYHNHPVVSLIHVFTGIAFIIFAPLQFSKKFRSKNLNRHRWIGRALIVFGLIASITGLLSSILLPAFGGFSAVLGSWFFGIGIIICFLRSFWCARNRLIQQHREWIMRAFAIGLGVGTQRILIFMFVPFQLAPFVEIFGPLLWLGTALNLIVAETWINLTRENNKT